MQPQKTTLVPTARLPITIHSPYRGGLGRTQDWEMVSPFSLLVPYPPPHRNQEQLQGETSLPSPCALKLAWVSPDRICREPRRDLWGRGKLGEGTPGQVASLVRGGCPPTSPPPSWAAAVQVTGSETGTPGGGGAAALARVGGGSESGWGSTVQGSQELRPFRPGRSYCDWRVWGKLLINSSCDSDAAGLPERTRPCLVPGILDRLWGRSPTPCAPVPGLDI